MEIFNKKIFGSDAEEFLNLSTCDKLEWIKKNTNQQNDELIKEFIKVATKGKDCKCLDCGKEKKANEISVTNATEIKPDNGNVVKGESRPNNTKRQRHSKKG